MRLAIVNDWETQHNEYRFITMRGDGWIRTLQILNQDWDVKYYKLGNVGGIISNQYIPINLCGSLETIVKSIKEWKPDVILVFGDLTRPVIPLLKQLGIPMALHLTGGTFRNYVDAFDLFFVESEVYKKQLESEGKRVIQAFGTNTKIFKPIKQVKIWDAIFPAVFANWKRHSLFAQALEEKGLACGYMYHDHEIECWKVCQENATMILEYQSAEAMNYLYNASRTCVITSDSSGGSQRTVLEAMACNIPVIVMSDSDKTTEFIRKCGVGEIVAPEPARIRAAVGKWKNSKVNTRDWVLKNHSEYIYAKKIKEGILSICRK